MHDDEIAADAALARRLVDAQFPRWRSEPLSPVPSAGTDNALFRLGSDRVVRLPRIAWAVDAVAREQRWLRLLAPRLPVAIPVPLAVGEPAFGYPWPWSIAPWLAGENPHAGRVEDVESLAAQLGAFVAALRRVDARGAPASWNRGGALAARRDATERAIDELGARIATRAVRAAWHDALRVPAWREPPTWIHADLSPGNLLCANGALVAVIDFGCLGCGDPAVDLIAAWNLLPASARPALRAAAGVDDDTWARARGWALSIALGQLSYYETRNPPLAANARHVIAEVLAERA